MTHLKVWAKKGISYMCLLYSTQIIDCRHLHISGVHAR